MLKPIAFLLFILPFGAFGQYNEIDSLNLLLTEQQTDSTRMSVYRQLCTHYRYVNQDSSLYFGNLAYALAKHHDAVGDQARALRQLSYHYLTSSEFFRAKELALQALTLFSGIPDTALMADASNVLGLTNWKLQHNRLAIRDFQNAYEWSRISREDKVLRSALNNLGLISSELGRKQEAISYFEEVGEISTRTNDQEGQMLSLLNIAVIHKDLEEYEQALADFEKGLRLLEKGNDQMKIAQTYFCIADIQLAQGKLENALRNCDRALKISRAESLKDIELMTLTSKANILLEQGKYKEVIQEAEVGLQILETQPLPSFLTDFYKILSQAYKGLGDFSRALQWQEQYAEHAGKQNRIEKEKEIASLEISWASKQKEAENMLLRKEQLAKDTIINQRTTVALITGIAVLLLLVTVGLLYLNRRKTKRINAELERRVKERTEALEMANNQLMHSNEEIQRFAYIASHDMKEPIRNVGGFIGLIKKRLEQKKEHQLVEYIDYVQKANWQLFDLVENILEFSRINQQNHDDVFHADLNAVAKGVCILLDNKIKKSKAEIIYDDLPTIYFNPAIIKMILKRLIENAIKYNESGRPEVRISHRFEAEKFLLSVKDNGIGIAPDFQEKIFDMFTRLHNRGAYGGAGMGLSYCKKLLSNYGGTITVESTEGQGSTFQVIIPAKIVHGEQDRTFVSNIKSSITTEN